MLLHEPHSSCRFSMWPVPPLARAMMWSTSKWRGSKCVAHPAQFPPCSPYSFFRFVGELYFSSFPMSVRRGTSVRCAPLSSVNYFSRSTTIRIPGYLPVFLHHCSSKVLMLAPGPRLRERTLKKDAKPPCPLPEAWRPGAKPRHPWSPPK